MMKRHNPITGRLAFILIALALTWGCGEQSDTARKPQVVRKKIVVAAKSPSPARKKPATSAPGKAAAPSPRSDIDRAKPSRSGSAPPKASSGKEIAASSKGLRPKSDIDRQPAPSKPAEVVAQKTAPQARQKDSATAVPAAGSVKTAPRPRSEPSTETPAEKPTAASSAGEKELQKKKPAVEKKQAEEKKAAPKQKGMPPPYNPEGKVDPFKPLFKEKPDLPEKRSRPKRIPRTPLERVALSQLKLTAIIMAPSGNRALVQEASGKGYVIRNGTYIGLNAGKVVEIQKDRVIIEEEVEDIVGKLIKRKQELKLPKPAEER